MRTLPLWWTSEHLPKESQEVSRGPSSRTVAGPEAERSSFATISRGQSCPPSLLLRPAQRRLGSRNPG
eukprot:9218231-Alexandrium_andersonii.AAC.1